MPPFPTSNVFRDGHALWHPSQPLMFFAMVTLYATLPNF
jgi:hypothetical protein